MHMKKQIASKKEKQDKRVQKYNQNYYYLKGESWCPVYIKKLSIKRENPDVLLIIKIITI